MTEYKGNAIYDYIVRENLDRYYFSAEDVWMLVYGNAQSIPKILVLALKAENIQSGLSNKEKKAASVAIHAADTFGLPFICVRFMVNSDQVMVWETKNKPQKLLSYDELRDLYETYGVVQPGTARKPVNQYLSSPYHDWQRNNLGWITVSDFDLLRYGKKGGIKEVIELKRSKYELNRWTPFSSDFPNFALLINTIIGSGKDIPFRLYYNVMKDGPKGKREEDISQIKVFSFDIPERMIGSGDLTYRCCGIYTLKDLLKS